MKQGNLFELLYPEFKIDKKIRLIELFAGVGSQMKAMSFLTKNVESYKICEWSSYSMHAYNQIHIKDFTNYAQDKSKDELIKSVKGVSTNYNEPLSDKQLQSKSMEWLSTVYNDVKATHNLINIMDVKGDDLEIVDTDKYDYVMSWSFPCQDLSLAGTRALMSQNSGTRSGLAWEVLRILKECEHKPQVLVMENVPQVIGNGAIGDFQTIELELEKLGYSNFVKVLNAKDYGIPQNRQRCFMISILGDCVYYFPQKVKLKYKLKDFLEKQVDESYYLSKKMIDYCTNENTGKYNRKEAFENCLNNTNEKGIAVSITTASGSRPIDNYIIENKRLKNTIENNDIEETCIIDCYNNQVHKDTANTITTRVNASNSTFIAIPEATSDDIRVCTDNLRIRKLTPRECWRLMSFQDKDFDSVKDISNAQLFHQAGDSICVCVLVGLFSQLLGLNSTEQIEKYIKTIKE